MLFSSAIFLFIFLPVLLAVYFLSGRSVRNWVLLAFSLAFYAWGEPRNIVLLLFSILVNFALALGICASKARQRVSSAKVLLLAGVAVNLGVLVFFKYTGFLVGNLNALLGGLGLPAIQFDGIALPVGISFFTFQALSYVIDVYRGKVAAQRNVAVVALYISMFPQLIAGPIVRYADIEKEISDRQVTFEGFVSGIKRFIAGLGKKVLIANGMAVIADHIFGLSPDLYPTSVAWMGAAAYMLQIYFDFSGYSDMAIGLGRMFGFHYLENFNYPYIAGSVTDFWRRWHISLSTWFRDYLYIPLGGNRKGRMRTGLNLLAVFLCTGLWHGASWNFVVWGLFHGLFLLLEKVGSLPKRLGKSPVWLRGAGHIATLLIVLAGWVIFRADTLTDAFQYLVRMVSPAYETASAYTAGYYLDTYNILLFVFGILLSTPVSRGWQAVKNRGRCALHAAMD